MFQRDFGEGATYFWQVTERGGALIFGAKKFEKARETHFSTHFLRDFGRGPLIFGKSLRGGATYFWQVAERGATYFWREKN